MTDFEQHYSDLFDYVYRYVHVRLNDRESTHDLVSKIFLSAFEKQHQYDAEKGSWGQWITGIARNAVFAHWKSNQITLILEDEVLDSLHFERHWEAKGKQDQQMMFQKLLTSVPSEVRMLLILRYEDDLTYESIAELLNKSPAAVRKTFSRLHAQLRAQFQDFID